MRYGSEGQEGEESRVLTVRGEKGTASITVIIAGGCWGRHTDNSRGVLGRNIVQVCRSKSKSRLSVLP